MVTEKIPAPSHGCWTRAAKGKPARLPVRGRTLPGFLMGSLTVALIGLTAGLGPTAALFLLQLILPVAIIATVLVVSLSSTARAAWGRLCLTNGIISIVLAAAIVEGRGQPLWPSDPSYERALDHAMQEWLGQMISTAAIYFGGAIVAAATLLALSYWLLRSPHGEHRDAE